MLSSLVILLISGLILSARADRHISSHLNRRNGSSSSTKISATVLSSNGTDVTSSFHTRIYHPPNIVAPDPSLTSRDNFSDLNPRGTLTYTYLGRPVGGDGMCRSQTAKFQHSVCKRSLGISAAMQDFLVYCQETPEAYAASNPRYTPRPSTANRGGHASTSYEPHDPPVVAEEGSCYADEMCIDGVFEKQGYPQLASCVLEDDFEENDDDEFEEEILRTGHTARVTVTSLDGRAPVRMRKLDIAAARRGGPNRGTWQKACVGCFALEMDSLAPNTDSLKVEASLMTVGAMAGILWVAVLSG